MKKTNWKLYLKVIGVIIMLVSFPIIPDTYPWYYEIILYNVGLLLLLVTKWASLKKEIGFS